MAVDEKGELYISGMNNKQSAGPDEISNQLLKPASPYIAGSLTYIFNLCIEQNVFPSEFQKAKTIPLPGTRDYKNMNDYRPVSLLSVLSKRLERHIHKHLVWRQEIFSIHFSRVSAVNTLDILRRAA